MSIYTNHLRLPAEWEPYGSVMIAWPHADTDWKLILPEVTECYEALAREIALRLPLMIVTPDPEEALRSIKGMPEDAIRHISIVDVPTNDTWTRDYGPITTLTDDGNLLLNDFKFNGWGLKFAADKDNLVNSHIWGEENSYTNHLNFVLEGGSIESDGRGTILTTSRCLLSKNRNGAFSRPDIEGYLSNALGARKILWLDHGALEGDDTDSHIDTLARLAPDDTIVYVKCDDTNDAHYENLNRMEVQLSSFTNADGKPFKMKALPLPDAICDEDGDRLPATYANYLVMPGVVLVPTYRQPEKDAAALRVIGEVYADREIVGVDCCPLIRQHGSLHCATMQLLNC